MKKRLSILIFFPVFFLYCLKSPDIQTDSLEISIKEKKGEGSFVRDISENSDQFYQVGIASWYGGKFNGRRTSNGEIYDMYKLTAAHKELPFNTIVEVENLRNRKRVIVRINDRGPFVKDRIVDLSYKAAISIDMDDVGTAPVVLRVVDLMDLGQGNQVVIRKLDYSHRSDFFLQAGAFSIRKNADALTNEINSYSGNIKFGIIQENGLFKVLSRKLNSREDAEGLKRTLEEHGFDTFIKEVFTTKEQR